MNRKVYISDEQVALCEYIDTHDDSDCYNCWQDEETQCNYNFKLTRSFDDWVAVERTPIFNATIIRLSDGKSIGSIVLSDDDAPDLSFMIYKSYRNQGYGARAFALGAKHCLETFDLDKIFAGTYLHNSASIKILEKCGFVPHPKGNVKSKHYLTGKKIIQYDYVKYKVL